LEQHIKSRLEEDTDNYVKKQMMEIRTNFDERLEQFRTKGTRWAGTIEEREKRMMGRIPRAQRDNK